MTEQDEQGLNFRYSGSGNVKDWISKKDAARSEYEKVLMEDPETPTLIARPSLQIWFEEIQLRLKNHSYKREFTAKWASLNEQYGDPDDPIISFRMDATEYKQRYRVLDNAADELGLRDIAKSGDTVTVLLKGRIEDSKKFIVKWLKHRIKNNKDALIGCFGPKGSGKSLGMNDLAAEADESYSMHTRIRYDADQMYDVVMDEHGQMKFEARGSAIMHDEAGAGEGAQSRSFSKDVNQDYNSFILTCRDMGLIIFEITPDIGDLDMVIRKNLTLIFEHPEGTPAGYFKVGKPIWLDKDYKKYTLEPISHVMYGSVKGKEGSSAAVEEGYPDIQFIYDAGVDAEYQQVRKEFTDQLRAKLRQNAQIRADERQKRLEKSKMRDETRIFVECPECHEIVKIYNNGKRQNCPECSHYFTLKQIKDALDRQKRL